MSYRWERDTGLPQEIASADLRPSDVPPAPTSPDDERAIGEMIAFAHTFNGYKWGGPPQKLGEVHRGTFDEWDEHGVLPDDLDVLRGCLFFWVRADRHGGGHGPTVEDIPWLAALIDGIREFA
jgi:hypothetical protein